MNINQFAVQARHNSISFLHGSYLAQNNSNLYEFHTNIHTFRFNKLDGTNQHQKIWIGTCEDHNCQDSYQDLKKTFFI